MKRAIGTETDDIVSSNEAASLMANTPSRMSDHEAENSSNVSVTSWEVAREVRAVTDPLTQQLPHICELLRRFNNEQAKRYPEETASFTASGSTSGSDSRSDSLRGMCGSLN